jgi:uridine phosphorylase
MPSRLRPTAPVAADAILVGDPGRALMLAQELLEQPRMSNHARGLWGYSGRTPDGHELTIQATGIGGPSAAAVLVDLAKLGVRRAVRVGTATGLGPAGGGELLVVARAVAGGGSATAFGLQVGEAVEPDAELAAALLEELGEGARSASAISFDALPHEVAGAPDGERSPGGSQKRPEAADLQTVAVLARARDLGVAAAAVLIVAEPAGGGRRLGDEETEAAAKRAGRAAAVALSKPKV